MEQYKCPTCGADGVAYVMTMKRARYKCTANKRPPHPTWEITF